jgi:hypothetical protein
MSLGRTRIAAGGKYTGGPIPLGYDLDEDNRFILSKRVVPQLVITEAEMVRGIFVRIVAGDPTANSESARLLALGVEKPHRYGGEAGRVVIKASRVRQITVETRRLGPRKMEADVRVLLRLKPEPIAVENNTPGRSFRGNPRRTARRRSGGWSTPRKTRRNRGGWRR